VSETKLFRGPDFEGALFGPVSLASLTESTDAAANVANARLAPLVAALERWSVAIRAEGAYAVPSERFLKAENDLFEEFRKLKGSTDE
jgi:hypothetical protein